MRPPRNNGKQALTGAHVGLALVISLLLTACEDSGPVEDVFLFEGEVAYQGSQIHSLVTREEGIARFRVLSLTPRLYEVSSGTTITVGLAVGRPDGEDCAASFRANAVVGSVFSIGLEKETEYCVEIFDPGTLPEDALVAYTVSVTSG